MSNVKNPNTSRVFRRLGTTVGLMGLAGCLGLLGLDYGKAKQQDETLVIKRQGKLECEHRGKVVWRDAKTPGVAERNSINLMVSSTAMLRQIGSLIPLRLSDYPIDNIKSPESVLRVFDVKSIFIEPRKSWGMLQLGTNIFETNHVTLSCSKLIGFVTTVSKADESTPVVGDTELESAILALRIVRALKLNAETECETKFMSALRSLSRVTAKCFENEVIGGAFVGSTYGVGFQMNAANDDEFLDGFSMSSLVGDSKDMAKVQIPKLLEELAAIPLPGEFLTEHHGTKFPDNPKTELLDRTSIMQVPYREAASKVLEALQNFIREPTVSDLKFKAYSGLGLDARADEISIWFFGCHPSLKNYIYDNALERHKLYDQFNTCAVQGQDFSLDAAVRRQHYNEDSKIVGSMTAQARSLNTALTSKEDCH